MKIYTRTGDAGETALFDGTRVRKSDPRVDAYGHVDELNAMLGLALAQRRRRAPRRAARAAAARSVRARRPARRPGGAHRRARAKGGARRRRRARLEAWIDEAEAELPPLRRFILPGGAPAGAALHVARTVCRRAERRIVSLGDGAVDPDLLAYVNRLSDLLFVLARLANARAGVADVEW